MADRTLFIVGAGAVLALVVVGYVAARRAGITAPGALNPLSSDNLAYQGASAVVEAITGVQGDTPGVALHRWLNPEYENWSPNAPAPKVTAPMDPWLELSPFQVGA